MDPFAFLNSRTPIGDRPNLPGPWELCPLTEEDLLDLEYFYEKASGGLMIKALDLAPHNWRDDTLSARI